MLEQLQDCQEHAQAFELGVFAAYVRLRFQLQLTWICCASSTFLGCSAEIACPRHAKVHPLTLPSQESTPDGRWR